MVRQGQQCVPQPVRSADPSRLVSGSQAVHEPGRHPHLPKEKEFLQLPLLQDEVTRCASVLVFQEGTEGNCLSSSLPCAEAMGPGGSGAALQFLARVAHPHMDCTSTTAPVR